MAGVQVQGQCDIDPGSRSLCTETLEQETSKCRASNEAADKAVDKLRGVQAVEKYKMCLKIEFVVLCAVVVVIWGLLSIPVILHHVPLVY